MGASPVPQLLGLELVMHVAPPSVNELRLTLEGLARPRPGCVERGAFQDLADPSRLLWVERWREGSDLTAYLDSEPFRALMGAAECLGRVEGLRFFQDWPTPAATPYPNHGEDECQEEPRS